MKKMMFVLFAIAATCGALAQEYTPLLPEASEFVGRGNGRDTLPEPVFEVAETTVVVHFEGELSGGIMFSVDPFTGEPKQLEPSREGNMLTYKFEQYATQRLRIDMAGGSLVPVANPGETIEAWVDLNAMRMHLDGGKVRYVYYGSGDFMHENNVLSTCPNTGNFAKHNYSRMSHGVKMPIASIENFVSDVVDKVERENAAVDAMTDLPGAAKEMLRMDNATMGLRVVANMKTYLQILRFGPGIAMEDNADKLGDLDRLGMDNMKLLYGGDFGYAVPAIAMAVNRAGLARESGWLGMGDVFTALKKAETREPLTDADRAAIAGSTPYFQGLFAHIEEQVGRQYSDAMGSGEFTIRETPEYASPDGVIDAIVAQYPGKVVFVDFWATWCGPCLQAMRTMKPLKPWMKGQDIVSVYITEVSSPKTRWTLALPEIGGEHYYLTREEWNAAMDRYGIGSIPYYMIYGRDGAQVFHNAGYPGNDALRAEFEKAL